MRICLIGADFEENLGLGILAAAVEAAGHEAEILPFNRPDETGAAVARVKAAAPDIVGLSIQFQHRAHEFLLLARQLRQSGFAGHMTAGGQFPTLAYREVLEGDHGVDTVVLHDGEETLVELATALAAGSAVADVAGLAFLGPDRRARRSAGRPLIEDLDTVPFPRRYREHTRHMGVPFIPIMAARGCWGKCNYCSIVAFFRDAKSHGGGRLFRLRSPENVAAEMALLWHRAGRESIFCFHDDNFLLPRPADSLRRVREIRSHLDDYGVGKIGIVGKCRPDTVTDELVQELAELGVIRLYVGVENASEAGGRHLRRGTQQRSVRAALRACEKAGIFACYNLLVFEPEATIDDVRENARFIREHADHPVNFCRAEPYYGTPLHIDLADKQDLGGSYLGWNYRIDDHRTELLFRICSAAFRERNFATSGVANRYMGLGYAAKVLERFYPEQPGVEHLCRRARELTRQISLDTAGFIDRAVELAERAALPDGCASVDGPIDRGAWDTVERETLLLGLEIAAADRIWHRELDALYDDMREFVKARPVEPERRSPLPDKLLQLARSLALGVSLAAVGSGCDCNMVVDPVPPDASVDAWVVDPPPPDAAIDAMVVDPVPIDAATVDAEVDAMVVDPPPADMGMRSPPGDKAAAGEQTAGSKWIDQWRDSSPKDSIRTRDLPLYEPPNVTLDATRDGERVRVRIDGVNEPVSARWESEGAIIGNGMAVEWAPHGQDDQLRVAVRSRGGVAVVTLRASEVSSI